MYTIEVEVFYKLQFCCWTLYLPFCSIKVHPGEVLLGLGQHDKQNTNIILIHVIARTGYDTGFL